MKVLQALALMMLAGSAASAEKTTVGYWTVESYDGYWEAFTGNTSGSTFGFLCGKGCSFYLDLSKRCVNGDKYPAMVNSKAGAISINLTCMHLNKRHILVSDDDNIASLIDGADIGFAVPLDGGLFSVSRFSLNGANRAMVMVTDAAIEASKQDQGEMKDFTL